MVGLGVPGISIVALLCQHGDLQQLLVDSWVGFGPFAFYLDQNTQRKPIRRGRKVGRTPNKGEVGCFHDECGHQNFTARAWPSLNGLLWGSFPRNLINLYAPWKFNIAPENIPSQKESSLPTIIFQGLKC